MYGGPLQVKQLAFQIKPAAIAAQRSAGRDDAMTGDNDGDRVAIVGHADGAKGVGMSDGARDVGISARLAEGDGEQRVPAGQLEGSSAQIEGHRKVSPLAVKVFVQFANVRRESLLRFAQLKFLLIELHDAPLKLEA